MSISIFYIIIGSVTLICSGMCFRCYVCNSNSDEHCDYRPTFVAQCLYSANGCVKLVNQMVEYKFIDSNGSEIAVGEWDGSDTGWSAVPYVKTIVTRRCGNNYARYQPKSGCSPISLSSNHESKEIICYCKSELCNGVTKSELNEFLRFTLLIFIPLYAYQT